MTLPASPTTLDAAMPDHIPAYEAAVGYEIEPAHSGSPPSMMFVFRGTRDECSELAGRLYQTTRIGGVVESRRALIVVIDLGKNPQN